MCIPTRPINLSPDEVTFAANYLAERSRRAKSGRLGTASAST